MTMTASFAPKLNVLPAWFFTMVLKLLEQVGHEPPPVIRTLMFGDVEVVRQLPPHRLFVMETRLPVPPPDPEADPTGAGGRANAKKYSNALSKAAKQAKGDIKATLKSLSSYYKSIANNDTQAIQNKAQDFAQASTKYANYVVTNCIAENLPSGVTIPKIPGQ